ncbi:MAG: [FeFe] hydrogenase H-cluster radical SAM maturase HydG, partial [Bacillota bacterium]
KTGRIANVCQPNAILTLQEYLLDYASLATRRLGEEAIQKHLELIPDEKIRKLTLQYLERIKQGERDLYL